MAEVLRAGPLSDERVIRLINRRFVPHAFDLMEGGALSSKESLEFLTGRRLVRIGNDGGMDSVDGHEVFVFDPGGRLLAKLSPLATSDDFVDVLTAQLKKHPKFNKPSPKERSLKDAAAKARVQIDLLDFRGAKKTLRGLSTPEGRFLLAQLARRESNWGAMKRYLSAVRAPAFEDQIRMERAYRLWEKKRYKSLAKHLADFPDTSPRYSEARYYEGLALYLSGDKDRARALWRRLVKTRPQDRWIYRADWALASEPGRAPRAMQSGGAATPLGRIGYMGRSNPDLLGPRK